MNQCAVVLMHAGTQQPLREDHQFLSDSLCLSLRLTLSIGLFEPISGLSWPHFLHI